MMRIGILALAALALAVGVSARAQETKMLQTAIFAGGCFWCVESDFDKVPGVVSTTSGYTGGHLENPSYHQVSAGGTGHYESVEIAFDPRQVSYEQLLDVYWHSVDPTDAGGQFCDRGQSYETAIFVRTPEQKAAAEASKVALEKSKALDQPIVTKILDAGPFYPAEDYHQDFYHKNPGRYGFYRTACGRDRTLNKLWGDQAHSGIPKH
jgi:peptide-methionine (S)-S-oxide reductase